MTLERPKRWVLKPADVRLTSGHAAQLGVSPLVARLLVLRGLTDTESAKRYLSSSLRSDLPSPFCMAGMEAAVDRIVRAVKSDEVVGVWGDYDVDGTTGAAVVVSFLREVGAHPVFYVPHRIDEGYGLNLDGLKRLRQRGVTLAITVDCGISNAREVEAAQGLGLDVVVVDHHQPPDELPPAVAVINPHQKHCEFPDKGLCAAGLAFYLVIGIRAKLREAGWFTNSREPDVRRCLDIVTLGTIADMVPLQGVNRTLIRRGLFELAASARPGVKALKQLAHIAAGEVSAGQVGFQLGPRINAAGRVDYGVKVVELLTTDSMEIALAIAQELEEHNRERRALEAEVLAQALKQAEARINDAECYTLVLAGEGWHAGVLGIVASRIVERFYRPTVVIGINGEEAKGSARSIRGFHMVEALRRCAAHLVKFGGHEYAGGLAIDTRNLESFAMAIEQTARETLTDEDLKPLLEIDAALNFCDINPALLRELDPLKPFGIGNAEPSFMTANAQVCERREFSTGVRFRLRQADRTLSGVVFKTPQSQPGGSGELLDVAYRLCENEWNGQSRIELKILDAKPSATPEDQLQVTR